MPSGAQGKLATFQFYDGEISDAQVPTSSPSRGNYIHDKIDFHKLDILGLPPLCKINILRLNKINLIRGYNKWRELHLY